MRIWTPRQSGERLLFHLCLCRNPLQIPSATFWLVHHRWLSACAGLTHARLQHQPQPTSHRPITHSVCACVCFKVFTSVSTLEIRQPCVPAWFFSWYSCLYFSLVHSGCFRLASEGTSRPGAQIELRRNPPQSSASSLIAFIFQCHQQESQSGVPMWGRARLRALLPGRRYIQRR